MKLLLVRCGISPRRRLWIAFDRAFRVSLKELSGIPRRVPFAQMDEQQLSRLRTFIEHGLITTPSFGRPLSVSLGDEATQDQKITELSVNIGIDAFPVSSQ